MSQADRRQRQALIDDVYARVREETARGREEDAAAVIEELGGRLRRLIESGRPSDLRSERWGIPPRIAVVYAEGFCAVDFGLRARELSRTIDQIGSNPLIDAVGLRVDSPGGEPTTADVVGLALERLQKPVEVSQGDVAASGGYWDLDVRGLHSHDTAHGDRLHWGRGRLAARCRSQGAAWHQHRCRDRGSTCGSWIRPRDSPDRSCASRQEPLRGGEGGAASEHGASLRALPGKGCPTSRHEPTGDRGAGRWANLDGGTGAPERPCGSDRRTLRRESRIRKESCSSNTRAYLERSWRDSDHPPMGVRRDRPVEEMRAAEVAREANVCFAAESLPGRSRVPGGRPQTAGALQRTAPASASPRTAEPLHGALT